MEDTIIEEYKKIMKFPKYYISNLGNVKNNRGIIISQRKSSNGYMRINLRNGNDKYEKPKTMTIHRLVAEAFIPNPNNLPQVNHKDGNKQNNKVDNLEWCTAKYNIQHSFANHLQVIKSGEKNHLSKQVKQLDFNNNLLNVYGSIREAERKTGTGNSEICKCCKGKQKQSNGYIWQYVSKRG